MEPINLKPDSDKDEAANQVGCCPSPEWCPSTLFRIPESEDPNLAEEGTITFRFTRRRQTIETDPKRVVEYSLDLTEILDATATEKPKRRPRGEDAKDALDSALKAVLEEAAESED